MSGHSKWHKIRRAKEATDSKKSKLFGQLARDIATAAKSDANPDRNPSLREAIARARKANMPQANIDRLLVKHADASTKEVTYEGFGPGGCAFLIITSTDNPNRTVSEIRTIFKAHGGNLGGPNSTRWKFDENYEAQYPTTPTNEDYAKITALISELEAQSDVLQLYTDAIQ